MKPVFFDPNWIDTSILIWYIHLGMRYTRLRSTDLDYVHAGLGRTNLHWRPHVAHKTFSKFKQRTNVLYPYHYKKYVPYPYRYKKGVPYFLAKIEAYRTYVSYRTAMEARLFGTTISSRTFLTPPIFLRQFSAQVLFVPDLFGADSEPLTVLLFILSLLFFCRFAQPLSRSVELL